MSKKRAPLGAILVFAACATSAPAPQPPETASPPPAADAAPDGTADPMRMEGMTGGRMGPEGMQGRHMQAHMGEDSRDGMGMGVGMRMRMGREAHGAPRETPDHLQEGERIFREVCSQCHTMDPPPDLAPPMSHVARHLREAFTDEDGAVEHVKNYLPSPEAERSILPEMARERFGLMPAQPLSAELLEAVGRYIWFLGSPQG